MIDPATIKKDDVVMLLAVARVAYGTVTCVDLTDDDKVVIRWDDVESEDVLSDRSPLWRALDLARW